MINHRMLTEMLNATLGTYCQPVASWPVGCFSNEAECSLGHPEGQGFELIHVWGSTSSGHI